MALVLRLQRPGTMMDLTRLYFIRPIDAEVLQGEVKFLQN